MNGVHDLGGLQDMGPVQHEKDEPVFHAAWEGRIYGIDKALGFIGKWNVDAWRHHIESISPADYLRMSYYEKWFARLVKQVVNTGLVTQTEMEGGRSEPGSSKATPPLTAAMVVSSRRPPLTLRLLAARQSPQVHPQGAPAQGSSIRPT